MAFITHASYLTERKRTLEVSHYSQDEQDNERKRQDNNAYYNTMIIEGRYYFLNYTRSTMFIKDGITRKNGIDLCSQIFNEKNC